MLNSNHFQPIFKSYDFKNHNVTRGDVLKLLPSTIYTAPLTINEDLIYIKYMNTLFFTQSLNGLSAFINYHYQSGRVGPPKQWITNLWDPYQKLMGPQPHVMWPRPPLNQCYYNATYLKVSLSLSIFKSQRQQQLKENANTQVPFHVSLLTLVNLLYQTSNENVKRRSLLI